MALLSEVKKQFFRVKLDIRQCQIIRKKKPDYPAYPARYNGLFSIFGKKKQIRPNKNIFNASMAFLHLLDLCFKIERTFLRMRNEDGQLGQLKKLS